MAKVKMRWLTQDIYQIEHFIDFQEAELRQELWYVFKEEITREEFIHFIKKEGYPIIEFNGIDTHYTAISGKGKNWCYIETK